MKIYTLIYSSGVKVYVRASKIEFTRYVNGRAEITWSDDIRPLPLYVGLDSIAAVFEGKV